MYESGVRSPLAPPINLWSLDMQRTYYIIMEFIRPNPSLIIFPIRIRCSEFELRPNLIKCTDAYVSVIREEGIDKESDLIPIYYRNLEYMNSIRVSEIDWPE